MDFAELLALLQNPGDDGLPDTIYDDLASSYQLAVDGGAASLATAQAESDALRAELAELKALLFDKFLAAEKAEDEPDNNTDPGDADTDAVTTIDDLFT
jgi:hypothetical protein